MRFFLPKFGGGIGLLLAFTLILNCSSGGSESNQTPTTPPDTSYKTPPSGTRDWLDHAELQSTNQSVASPYHNDYFLPIGEVENARHTFHGKLTITGRTMAGWPSNFPPDMKLFPSVEVEFYSHDHFLVPKNRDIVIPESEESYWRIIFSPGKTWFESSDQGMSRASFPFALVERRYNTTMNGVATFLFDDDSVSNLRAQIVQHTAPGLQSEAAATFSIDYTPTPDNSIDELKSQFDQELRLFLPKKPWSDLINKNPQLDWNHFYGQIPEDEISVTAIWFDQTLYVMPPQTPYGPYPFPQFMRHGIYSATKSAAGAVALCFLAQRYGPEILDYYVADYLDINATHDGWDHVRFIDCLNMATGIGNGAPDPDSTATHADENGPTTGEWSRSKTAREKLDIGFTRYGNYAWGPGEYFRYNTQHTFVLSAAMDQLTRDKEGKGLWELLKNHVYEPIGILHTPMMHTTEPDGSRGVPILGVGLSPTADHAVKIARLLHNLGEYKGKQILHRDLVASALYRTDDEGLIAHAYDNEFGVGRYHMSFWSIPFGDEQGCHFQVPFMNGAGGNLITILPNGVIALRYADNHNYNARDLIDIAGQLQPLCSH